MESKKLLMIHIPKCDGSITMNQIIGLNNPKFYGLSQRFKSTYSNKTKKVNYREVYNQSMINKVSEMYQDDIKLGDYKF